MNSGATLKMLCRKYRYASFVTDCFSRTSLLNFTKYSEQAIIDAASYVPPPPTEDQKKKIEKM
jgi:hypothetical protein